MAHTLIYVYNYVYNYVGTGILKVEYTIVYSHSVDPQKLGVGVKYYIVYTYVQYAILHLW